MSSTSFGLVGTPFFLLCFPLPLGPAHLYLFICLHLFKCDVNIYYIARKEGKEDEKTWPLTMSNIV